MTKRAVAEICTLTNAHTNPPQIGDKLLGLTFGGKLVELTWSADSINFIDAVCAYPKIPLDVKAIQSNRSANMLGW